VGFKIYCGCQALKRSDPAPVSPEASGKVKTLKKILSIKRRSDEAIRYRDVNPTFFKVESRTAPDHKGTRVSGNTRPSGSRSFRLPRPAM